MTVERSLCMHLLLAATLALTAWTGPPPAAPDEVQYRLTVRGSSGDIVSVRATHVPKGWIAAFCTAQTCSPWRADVTVAASGQSVVRFDLIRTDPRATPHGSATVTNGTQSLRVSADLHKP